TLSTRGILVPADIQTKTTPLLKGLLTRNPKKRWGKKEITDWLSGRQNIPVHYEEDRTKGQETWKPYDFRDELFYNPHDLTYAFIRDPPSWEDAKQHIGRGYLTRWLEKSEQYGAAVEVEKYIEKYRNEDERLLYITARFNPDIPFTLYGKRLDISSITQYLARYQKREHDEEEKKIISMIFSGDLHRIYQTYSEIIRQPDDTPLISRMFTWLSANTRGIDEKKRLYEYLRVLKEQDEIGPPQEWDAKTVLRLVEIRDLFLRQGYDADSITCEENLTIATRQALSSETTEPDLLVALASVSEEFGQTMAVAPCLKKASESDIRVISLLFSKKTGVLRFKLYRRLRIEYETNLYSLSSEPWKEPIPFWKDLFFTQLSEGNYPLALSISERIIEMDRMNAEGLAMRGVSLSRIGRVKEADYFLSGKIVQSSTSPLIWQLFGEYYAGLGNFEESERSFRKGLENDTTHTGSLSGLIQIYFSQKRYHEVISLCDTALIRDPDNQGFLLRKGDAEFALGRIPQATSTYERYLTLAPLNTGALKSLARCQIKLKKISDAERTLIILLEQGIRDPQVFRLKAYLFLIAGKIQEALLYLDMILEIEPGDIWTLRMKTDAQISLKKFGPALLCIDRILEIDPNNYLFFDKKAKIFLSLGFFSEASGALKHAIEGGRRSTDLYTQYGDALKGQVGSRYGTISDQDREDPRSLRWRVSTIYLDIWSSPDLTPDHIQILTEAMDWYERSATLTIEGASLWNRKGIVAGIRGDFDQARLLFKRAIGENNEEPAYSTNFAVMHLMMGDSDRGSALLLQGMKRFSKNAYFLDQCAGLYYQGKRDLVAALNLINQAIKVNITRDPIILFHKYLILKELGRDEEARAISRVIRTIDPGFILSDQ
ncbi:MAG: hypothetical protein CVV33_04745, partial [Methanomicrobiales archaeon HGW-Methanomicrobiales-4]